MAVAADPVPGTGCQSDLGAAGDRDCHFTDHFRIPSDFYRLWLILLLLFLFFGMAGSLLVSAVRMIFVSWASAGLALGGMLICAALFLVCLCGLIALVKKVWPWAREKAQEGVEWIRERRNQA